MKIRLMIVLAAALTVSAHTAAQAQGRSHIGPQLGYNFDYEAVVLGAQFSAPLATNLEFYPSFNYFFVDVGKVFDVNLDLKYRLPIEHANWLYIGGGLNVTRSEDRPVSSTDARVNLIAGIESRKGNVHPFGEFRLTAGQGSTIQLVGGLNFTLGGHSH